MARWISPLGRSKAVRWLLLASNVTKVDGNVMVTSYLGFKGVEDIGGGLKAGYTLETFLRPDTGAAGRSDADVF